MGKQTLNKKLGLAYDFNLGTKTNDVEMYKDGTIVTPNASLNDIDSAGEKVLTTKEWVNANGGGGGDVSDRVRFVDSIANLEALTSVSAGDTCKTISYYGDNNGGGNQFTCVDDQGGTLIPNGGTIIASTLAGFVWVAEKAEYIEQWGAIENTDISDLIETINAFQTDIEIQNNYIIDSTAICSNNVYMFSKNLSRLTCGETVSLTNGSMIFCDRVTKGEFFNIDFYNPNKTSSSAVYAENSDNIKIMYCESTNVRFQSRNTELAEHKGFDLIENKINADFTDVDYENTQFDVISIYGIKDISIKSNNITINNIHRVCKMSDTLGVVQDDVTAFNTEKVEICHNTIKGNTTSNKQVFDFFKGTNKVLIDDNELELSGFNSIINDKTSSIPNGVIVSFKISNNTIKTDALNVIILQGRIGLTTGSYDGYFYNTDIFKNTITSLNAIDYINQIRVNFYSNSNIYNNDTFLEGGDIGFLISVSGTALVKKITGNNLASKILESKSSTNQGGAVFDIPYQEAIITNNTIRNFRIRAGIEYVSSNDNYFKSLTIKDNKIYSDCATCSDMYPIWIYASTGVTSTIDMLDVQGNFAEMPNFPAKEYMPIRPDVTITKLLNINNKWVDDEQTPVGIKDFTVGVKLPNAIPADSSAADITTLVTDYNNLLAKLRANQNE